MSYIRRPDHIVEVVLDTDTFNEVDDQFALSYLLFSEEKVKLTAVYAAPFYDEKRQFFNYRSDSAAEGMQRSYDEIIKILELAGRNDGSVKALRGADRFMGSDGKPVSSLAVSDLIERALAHSPEDPLYVVGIAAPTNIAGALLTEPAIARNIVVIWLGGNTFEWPTCREFNLSQDLAASRALFENSCSLVQIPCMGVASAFTVTETELRSLFLGRNRLCDYLAGIVLEEMDRVTWLRAKSRILWDVTACAWLTGNDYVLDRPVARMLPGEERYLPARDGAQMNQAYHISRDALVSDLFARIGDKHSYV